VLGVRISRQGYDVAALPDRFYLAAYLSRECKAPLPARHFPFVQLHGYHFDAALLGGVLREQAIAGGARHIDCEIDEVVRDDRGNIAALHGAGGVRIDGDFFIFEGVRDYIVAHYRMSRRSDNDYWRDNATHDEVSAALDGVLRCWFDGGNLGAEVEKQNIARYYTAASWHCLLGGYWHFPKPRYDAASLASGQRVDLTEIDDFLTGC